MDFEKFSKIFEEDLLRLNQIEDLSLNPYVINYISLLILKYINNLPMYLIDIKETTTFKIYKAKGDISLLLVGFFTEWLNRLNRPLSEEVYIEAGKQNYQNAYFYLDINYGKALREEIGKNYFKYIKNQKEILNTYLEIFREISDYFEVYAYLLKRFRKEQEYVSQFLEQIPAGKMLEFEKILNKIKD